MTKFQILVRDSKDGAWHTFGVEEAHNAESAAKTAYLKQPRADIAAIVAVPARSWKPTAIRTEVTERVVLGEAPDEGAETAAKLDADPAS